MPTTRYDYDAWADCYEPRWRWLSGGRYQRFRAGILGEIQAGDRVVLVGAGSGDDAVVAAQRGARVTCLDLSAAMLAGVEARMRAAGLQVSYACEDVLEHRQVGHYDAVVVSNFLGLFERQEMRAVLRHCAALARPGGAVLVAELEPAGASAPARALGGVLYGGLVAWNWLCGKAALHGSRNWPAECAAAGLDVQWVRRERLRPGAPVRLTAIAARRVSDVERQALVRAFGRHPLSYSALQPGLAWFFGRRCRGAIAYRTSRGLWRRYRVVLGDPLCAPAERAALLGEFVADCAVARVGCLFTEIHGSTAGHLHGLGLRLLQMGVETDVALAAPQAFAPRSYLERQRRRQGGLSIEIEELAPREVVRLAPRLARVSASWCARTRQGRELAFLTRPARPDGDPAVRVFAAWRDGVLGAFVTFSPLWWRGRCIGYYADHARAVDAEADRWRSCVVGYAAAVFRDEGVRRLALGYSPAYPPHCAPARRAGELRWHQIARRALFAVGGAWFPFAGLAAHKRRYHGRVSRVWVAFEGPLPLGAFLALVRVTLLRIRPWPWRSAARRRMLGRRWSTLLRPTPTSAPASAPLPRLSALRTPAATSSCAAIRACRGAARESSGSSPGAS